MTAKQKIGLRHILPTFLRIGLIGFGGGNALVPLIRSAFVDQKQLLDDDVLHDKIFLANITPGALPVELACGIGKDFAGGWGMILAPFVFSLPGAILTVLFLMGFSALDGQALNRVQLISVGVSLYVIYKLIKYIRAMFRETTDIRQSAVIFAVTVILVCSEELCELVGQDIPWAPDYSTTEIMLFVLVLALLLKWPREGLGLRKATLMKAEGLWLLAFGGMILPALMLCSRTGFFLLAGALSTVLSFGGGDAYLKLADDLLIGGGIITAFWLYRRIVPVVNVLPGSVLVKTLTAAGYLLGSDAVWISTGLAVALAGVGCGVFCSCATYLLVENIYSTSRRLALFSFIEGLIRPIVSASMVYVIVSLMTNDLSILAVFFGF